MRGKAYRTLQEKLKELEPKCRRVDVQKKINNLRSSFTRDFLKVKDSKPSGSSADNVHVPKLRYFDEMMFIKDQLDVESGESTISNSINCSICNSHSFTHFVLFSFLEPSSFFFPAAHMLNRRQSLSSCLKVSLP